MVNLNLTQKQILSAFSLSVFKLTQNDLFLLKNNIHEQALSARLAMYLREYNFISQLEKQGLRIDCEYNHDGIKNKKSSNGKLMRPDIILHERGVNDNNVFVCEIKKSREIDGCVYSDDNDVQKILCRIQKPYSYSYGIYIYQLNSNRIELLLFRKEKDEVICNKYEYNYNLSLFKLKGRIKVSVK